MSDYISAQVRHRFPAGSGGALTGSCRVVKGTGVEFGSWLNKREPSQFIGEALREAAVLIAVLYPLETIVTVQFDPKR